MPEKFWSHQTEDFSCCDLLLVLGTSLVVSPFNTLVGKVDFAVLMIPFIRLIFSVNFILPAQVFCEPVLHQQNKARSQLFALGMGSQHDGDKFLCISPSSLQPLVSVRLELTSARAMT